LIRPYLCKAGDRQKKIRSGSPGRFLIGRTEDPVIHVVEDLNQLPYNMEKGREASMTDGINRRDFLKGSLLSGAGCALGLAGLAGAGSQAHAAGFWGSKPAKPVEYHSAGWSRSLPGGVVECTLCPLMEKLADGRTGMCRVRHNRGGRLYVSNYGRPSSLHLDPVEKNPLYHYTPGVKCLALATAGCNLSCPACQNWEISQKAVSQVESYSLPPDKAIFHAKKNGCQAISYTFSEPVVFYEYLVDTAALAKKAGLASHVVSGGYVSPGPLRAMCRAVDSFVISIKGTQDSSYGGRPGVFGRIRETMKIIREEGRWLEVAVLVTPGVNDGEAQLMEVCRFVKESLGELTPIHFSRFFPSFRLGNLPQTPVSTLEKAVKIAGQAGLQYAYVGNVPGHGGNNTHCHHCKKMIVQRVGFRVLQNHVAKGRCAFCGGEIPGIWALPQAKGLDQ
jgi:pyruvate formate lyase activating enzyme